MTRIFLALALLGVLVSPVAPRAQTAPSQQQADIAQIETYLNGLTTAQADFTFAQSDGGISRGLFTLNRPSKLRFEYTDPKGNLLIADGSYVIWWDAKAKEASNESIGSTPLSILLQPHISLSDGVRVTNYKHEAGVIRVTLVQTKDPDAGAITVAFDDQPLALKSWHLDASGQTTDVSFSNWKMGVPVDAALFKFQDPGSGRRRR